MFGIGMPELILIAVVALIVLGPKKLPDLAKSMGRAVREFRKATNELKETLQVDEEFTEVKKAFTDFHTDVNKAILPEAPPSTPADAPTQPAAEAPTETAAPADPPPAEPLTTDKLNELKKAFQAWNTGTAPTSPPPAETPPPAAPKPSGDKPRA
jgi:sec-independent protein translocase protein TatB